MDFGSINFGTLKQGINYYTWKWNYSIWIIINHNHKGILLYSWLSSYDLVMAKKNSLIGKCS
jgi:hypothetical protein